MLITDPETIQTNLMEQAKNRFGLERAAALQPEIEVMASQLAELRATPVDLQDEP